MTEIKIVNGFEGVDNFISSNYGEMIFKTNTNPVSTGYFLLDSFLGGGLNPSKFIAIIGNAGSGKTTFVINVMKNIIESDIENNYFIYMDAERAAKERIEGLGFDIDETQNIIFNDKIVGKYLKPRSIEGVAKFLKNLTDVAGENENTDKKIFVVVDSFAQLPAMAEIESNEIGSNSAGLGIRARLLSELFRVLPGQLERSNVTLIGINQMRQKLEINPMMKSPNPLGFKRNETMPGGQAMLFSAYQMLYLQPATYIKNNKTGVKYGRLIKFYIMKNKMMIPFIEFEMMLSYLSGFHNIFSLFFYAKDKKLITSGGAWWTLDGYEKKFKVGDFIKLYKSDETFRNLINEKINNFIEETYLKQDILAKDNINEVTEENGGNNEF